MAILASINAGLHRFRRHESGAIAVEFVLVAPIFFFLIFAILETSILYTIATVMEGEVALAARTIRTGQLQQEADPETAFRDILCSNLDNVGEFQCEVQHRWRIRYPSVAKQKTVLPCQNTLISPPLKGIGSPL